MPGEDLQLLVALHMPSHCTSARAVRLSQHHRHRQFRSIAYMCLLVELLVVQEMAMTGQRFPVASAEHSSCFQKEAILEIKVALGAMYQCYSLKLTYFEQRTLTSITHCLQLLCKRGSVLY